MTDKKRWYYRIDHFDDEEEMLLVEIYDADFYDKTGCLQDCEVREQLPEALQPLMDEVAESQFYFDGDSDEFCTLMDEYKIEMLPDEHGHEDIPYE